MLRFIDSLLDHVTMYRLLLYYLGALLLGAIVFGQFGELHFTPVNILFSTTVLLLACWLFNKLFAWIMTAPTNHESSLITALILGLIFSPADGLKGVGCLVMASFLAMASKYVLAINRKHIFNPAAVAAVLMALGPLQPASWWVGTAVMLPLVIIGGLLVVRKLRRFQMVFTFLVVAHLATIVCALLTKGKVGLNVKEAILDSGLFFMAFVMFTEPLTSPPTLSKQRWYGVLVGAIFPPQFHILSLYSTPELALVAGNIFSYLVSPKIKLFLRLKDKVKLTPDAMDLVFDPGQKLAFEPGQYMEWTLPHKDTDARGNRRFFTLASSPTEADIHLGIKFAKEGSSYKRAMRAMTSTTPIVGAQITGDFTLPKDASQKLAFIAGGIGVTPYRSMVKYLIDTKDKRDVMMLYSARTAADLAYKEVFEEARRQLGLRTVYMLTDKVTKLLNANCRAGYITAEVIKAEIPDYKERLFYLSGTHAMVADMQDILTDLGVPYSHVKLDFFPGYA